MANSDFLLQFQEFDEDGSLPSAPRDSTSVDVGHVFNQQLNAETAPQRTENESDITTDDQTKLLSEEKTSAPFWTFEYYQTFFDVDTLEVRERIFGSILPWRGKNFVRLHIRNNPDLYGPFWICATLVFAIAISGNISTFLKHRGDPHYKYVPEFRKVTMAATAIYSYAWFVPLALWGFLSWRNNKIMNSVSYSFLEIVCVYGYSLSIYIPAVVLWIIPSEGMRWISIVGALCLSGSVLVMTFWPAIRDDKPRVALAVVVTIVALHVLLAVGCKAYFFSTRDYDNISSVKQDVVIKTMPTAKLN